MDSVLHIQDKKSKKILNLKVVFAQEETPELVEKKENRLTLISEDKTYYLYFDKKSDNYNFQSIYNFFVSFACNNERQINIEIKSFISPKLKEELVLQAVVEGILYGSHRFITYKTNQLITRPIDYYLITNNKEAKKILINSLIKLKAVNFARDLQDSPPNKLHAKEFAEKIKKTFSKDFLGKNAQYQKNSTTEKIFDKITVEILEKKDIEKAKMGLLLSVNAGSHHEPRVVILRYKGNPKNKEILGLVGKGITFDSGGYNLKSSNALQTMKFDMSGAAVICASFLALIEKKPKVNVVAVACLTENVIGGHATLTESVITSMSGKTVEINNTDAEGRLVLADGITYAIKKEKATKIITIATLTGAVISALGENLTGIFTNNRNFYRELRQSLVKSQERYWELPIIPENIQAIKENTTIADISNITGGPYYMGASSAAAFLQEFVQGLPFIHCDIAGTAVKTKIKRGTGAMVRTLIELLCH